MAGKGRVVASHTITTYVGGELVSLTPGRFIPRERTPPPGVRLLGDWVDPKSGFNVVEKRKICGHVGIRTTIFRLTSTLLAMHSVS